MTARFYRATSTSKSRQQHRLFRWPDVATAHWKHSPARIAGRHRWIVLRHEIDYKMPASLGDEIVLRTWVGKASRLKFERFTEIRRKSGRSNTESSGDDINPPPDGFAVANNQVLAQARTLWVPVDVAPENPSAFRRCPRAIST